MSHNLVLSVKIAGRYTYNLSSGCISFRLEKERYTPYTELHAVWYCTKSFRIGEITNITFKIDGVVRHMGYPTDGRVIKKDGRIILDLKSRGSSSLLAANQCVDGLVTQVDLGTIVSKAGTFPNVSCQSGTPTVNYVNYYQGTSVWDAVVCYAVRAVDKYPYIAEHNTVRISPPETVGSFNMTTAELISMSYHSDFTRMVSKITMSDIDGTENAFSEATSAAARRGIVKTKAIRFDREWIQDPAKGVSFKMNCSMRAIAGYKFSFIGCSSIDLLDNFAVSDLNYSHEVDRILLEGSAAKGYVTTVWCYHDVFCGGA